MTFSDIFKNNFLDQFSEVQWADALIALSFAFLLGLLIYMLYKRSFNGVMYSESFNLSLILLTLLTTFVILAVTSNVVLSLGMVGALSIVRFRTAIKDPLDLVYLFWAIGGGIVIGAGMIPLAFIGSTFIATILLLKTGLSEHNPPYLLILRIHEEIAEAKAEAILYAKTKKSQLKSKSKTLDQMEVIYEIQLKKDDHTFINELAALNGIHSVQCLRTTGEYNE